MCAAPALQGRVVLRMKKFLAYLFALALLVISLPAAAPAQMAGRTTAGPAYRVNPGDDLDIMVWGD
jgi:protein involved in polysaccharide export with SLBB domain